MTLMNPETAAENSLAMMREDRLERLGVRHNARTDGESAQIWAHVDASAHVRVCVFDDASSAHISVFQPLASTSITFTVDDLRALVRKAQGCLDCLDAHLAEKKGGAK